MDISEKLKAESLSSKQCADLLSQVNKRAAEVRDRLAGIKPAEDGRRHGSQRAKTLETGSTDDVRALNAEYADLLIEADQLQAQRTALQRRKDAATAREAAESVSDLYARLGDRLKALEDAQKGLAQAWQTVDDAYKEASQARLLAIRTHQNPGGANSELVSRVINARNGGVNIKCRVAKVSPGTIADELGAEPEQAAA